MSDSIQSISQGNYILQGTVATSAGIVGDGSTQNPLRADETVLWSGAYDTNPTAFNLSEPLSSFEKIGFYGLSYASTYVYYESPSPTGNTVSVCYTYYCADSDGNPFQARMSRFSTSNGKDYNWIDGKFIYYAMNGLTAAGGTTGHKAPIYKIIGINRLSGSNA